MPKFRWCLLERNINNSGISKVEIDLKLTSLGIAWVVVAYYI